ncbi:LuxR C-terminal-related transcriptional regulator [Streptomyces sp. NPDC048604]|uniref:LuxR C-terminal-related transcriptional regulator n=1 Tax=Streptomyces sp. NPDC048604 TaxID=3365578 RepID=UPI0037186490
MAEITGVEAMVGASGTSGRRRAAGRPGAATPLPSPDGVESALYAYAAARESLSLDELLAEAQIPEEEARAAVGRLLEWRLIRPTGEEADRYVAVPPATASTQFLMPAIRELHERQQEISRACAQLNALIPVYESTALGITTRDTVQRLTDLATVRQVLTELSARAQGEVLTSQPGGARPQPQLDEALSRTTPLLDRGVRMRTIYQYTAQFHQPTVQHVALLTERGAEVRTVGDALPRMIVFDRETAFIDLVGTRQGAVVLRDPSLVTFVADSFERAWAQALAFPRPEDRGQAAPPEQLRQEMLRLLTEGHEDTVVAKRLGMSVRTLQRHLSEIMRTIGARNRLHAGYLIHEAGLLKPAN